MVSLSFLNFGISARAPTWSSQARKEGTRTGNRHDGASGFEYRLRTSARADATAHEAWDRRRPEAEAVVVIDATHDAIVADDKAEAERVGEALVGAPREAREHAVSAAGHGLRVDPLVGKVIHRRHGACVGCASLGSRLDFDARLQALIKPMDLQSDDWLPLGACPGNACLGPG